MTNTLERPRESGETAERTRSSVDALESAVYVLGLAAAVALSCAFAAYWQAGAWAVTIAAAVGLVTVGRHLTAPHAVFAAVLGWCLVTGFVANGDAELTFRSSDLWRLAVLALASASTRIPNLDL